MGSGGADPAPPVPLPLLPPDDHLQVRLFGPGTVGCGHADDVRTVRTARPVVRRAAPADDRRRRRHGLVTHEGRHEVAGEVVHLDGHIARLAQGEVDDRITRSRIERVRVAVHVGQGQQRCLDPDRLRSAADMAKLIRWPSS